jgi:hypothetical protein
MLNWIGSQSIRKPLGWLVALYILTVVGLYIGKGLITGNDVDIPPGIQSVVMALVAIPCTVIGSSSYEAVRQPKEEDNDKGHEDSV